MKKTGRATPDDKKTNVGWPAGASRSLPYLAFHKNTDEDQAAARFKERFGKEPEFVFETADGYLRVGPLQKHNDG